jgi:hypothetical protein
MLVIKITQRLSLAFFKSQLSRIILVLQKVLRSDPIFVVSSMLQKDILNFRDWCCHLVKN